MTLTLYVQIKCFSCSDFLPYEILGATSPLWAANSAGSGTTAPKEMPAAIRQENFALDGN